MNIFTSVLSLIAPLDTSTVQADHEPEVLPPNRGVEPSAAADKDESNWKYTASATAKLILRTVKESSDAFPPLKSVAGGLCAILENSEVQYASHSLYLQRSQQPQRTTANKEAIESLAPRVKALAESLCAPISELGTQEESRRKALER